MRWDLEFSFLRSCKVFIPQCQVYLQEIGLAENNIGWMFSLTLLGQAADFIKCKLTQVVTQFMSC